MKRKSAAVEREQPAAGEEGGEAAAGHSLPSLRMSCRTPSAADLVFGASGIGCLYRDVSEKEAGDTVEAALKAGIDYIDTAPWYGAGLSERRLGKLLEGKKGVVLSTKCGRIVRPLAETDGERGRVESHYKGHFITEAYHADIPVATYTAEGIRESFRQSCERLGLTRLGCLRLHDAEDEVRWKEATEGGGVEALLELRRQGLVGTVGLGMGSAEYALRFLRTYPRGTFDSLMLAGCWNLIDQDGLEVLQECQRLEVPVINVGIFASGILWGPSTGSSTYKYREAPAAVVEAATKWKALASSFGLALPELALHFALMPEIVTRIAVGCSSPEQVAGNVALCGKEVPSELWRRAKTMGLLAEGTPLPEAA